VRHRDGRRAEFLTTVLTTAIESGSLGWFVVHEYRHDSVPLGSAYALIEPEDQENITHRVDLDVIARGLALIRDALPLVQSTRPSDGPVLCDRTTGKRLYVSAGMRSRIMAADRSCDEDGDLDAIDALSIVECGLFGQVVYA
jgi:hypothetical protein